MSQAGRRAGTPEQWSTALESAFREALAATPAAPTRLWSPCSRGFHAVLHLLGAPNPLFALDYRQLIDAPAQPSGVGPGWRDELVREDIAVRGIATMAYLFPPDGLAQGKLRLASDPCVTVGVSADTPAATMEDDCRDAGRRLADLLARLYERCSQGGEARLLYWPGGLAAAQRPPSPFAPSPGPASHQPGDPVEARGERQAPRTLGEIQLRAGRLPRRALSEWVSLKAFVPVAIVDAEGFQQLSLSGLVG